MPELPEVHTTATMLNRLIKNKQIFDAWTNYGSAYHKGKNHIKNRDFFAKFRKIIIGKKIESVRRRGKNVLIHLSGNLTIIVHMKMTGHLLVGEYELVNGIWRTKNAGPLSEPKNQYIRFVITFSDNSHLVLSDLRKFAKVTAVKTSQIEKTEDLSLLGPDPTVKNFSFSDFKTAILQRPQGKIKAVLLDQTILSGIGNIYSDEILWQSGIHPESIVSKIPIPAMKKMFEATKLNLKKGVSLGGDSTSDYRNPLGEPGKFHLGHKAYRKTGLPCEKKGCEGKIKRMAFGGRGAHFCDHHQTLFK